MCGDLDSNLLILDELAGIDLDLAGRSDGQSGGEAGPGGGVGGDGVGDGLGVVQQHADVEVLDVVLRAVVVGVQRDARSAAPDGHLLGRLDLVRPRV